MLDYRPLSVNRESTSIVQYLVINLAEAPGNLVNYQLLIIILYKRIQLFNGLQSYSPICLLV
jgi:hypothetical protein